MKKRVVDTTPPNAGLTYFMWVPGAAGPPTPIKISKDKNPPRVIFKQVTMSEEEKTMSLDALAARYPL